jgi:hypothetical protein
MRRVRSVLFSAVFVVGAVSASAQSTGQAASATPTPTFTKDVAPILYKSCVSCHRPGEIGPMALISYQDARPWSKSIREKVVKKEMPPWSADPARSVKFRNDPSLTPAQIATIAAWVDGGSPKGDDTDLPAVPTFAQGWKNGEPDLVIEMPVAFELPAEGELPIQDFFVKSPLTEDTLVEAVEIRPGNPAVVHHGNAYVVTLPPDAIVKDGRAYTADGKPLTRKDIDFGPGGSEGGAKLLSYVPGRGYERYGKGAGKRIPGGANTYINFYMHYQVDGQPETDRTKVGIYFAKEKLTHEIVNSLGFINATTFSVEGKELDGGIRPGSTGAANTGERGFPNIPPYAENWKIVGITPVTEPVTLYGLTPHLHLRGKDMTYLVTYPDGREVPVLTVPKYDFNWQHYYDLETPLQVPAGSKITVITHFDNSLKNPYNPAPEKEVYWSEQSWDEMYAPQIRAVIDNRVISGDKAGTQQRQQR